MDRTFDEAGKDGTVLTNIDEMRKRKKELGYSYLRISQISGLPVATVQKVLGGITSSPREATLAALEKALFPERDGFFTYGSQAHRELEVRESDAVYGGGTSAKSDRESWRLKKQGEFTIQDREAFPDDRRTELIDGVIYDMASPSYSHQMIAGQIYYQLCNYIYSHEGPCNPYIAPADVRLDRDDYTMLQPDVFIVCNKDDVAESEGKYLNGSPDFVVEILSPSTRKKDMDIKLSKYRNSGVREYWIVDLAKERVIVFLFGEDPDVAIYSLDSTIPISIYNGDCQIDFAQITERVRNSGA